MRCFTQTFTQGNGRTAREVVYAVSKTDIQHGTGRVADDLSGRFQMQ
jgi:hypothetical protein